MTYRHEWKYQISRADAISLRPGLRAVMKPDPHASDGTYTVRSLYFDTPGDKALREKINSVNTREKFRIRYYNGDTGFIQLEKKFKCNGLGIKEKARLTAAEAQSIAIGDIGWMPRSPNPLVRELYAKMRTTGLHAKTIVEYTREAYAWEPGNARVTLDSGIRTSLRNTHLLDPQCPTIPIAGNPIILEVKWDRFLPDIIRDVVQVGNRRVGAFSKYAESRMYE